MVLPELRGEVHPSRQVLGLVTLSLTSWTLAGDNRPSASNPLPPCGPGWGCPKKPQLPSTGLNNCVQLQMAGIYSASRLTVFWELWQSLPVPAVLEAIDLSSIQNYGYACPSLVDSPIQAEARGVHASIRLMTVQGKGLFF